MLVFAINSDAIIGLDIGFRSVVAVLFQGVCQIISPMSEDITTGNNSVYGS